MLEVPWGSQGRSGAGVVVTELHRTHGFIGCKTAIGSHLTTHGQLYKILAFDAGHLAHFDWA